MTNHAFHLSETAQERIKAEIASGQFCFDRHVLTVANLACRQESLPVNLGPILGPHLPYPRALHSRRRGALRTHRFDSVLQYWGMSAGFALIAFFAFRLQDGMTRHFSFQEAIDIAEAVLFAQLLTCAVLFTWSRLDGIPRSAPLIHGLLLGAGLIAARIVVRIATGEYETQPAYQDRRERVIVIGSNRLASAFIQLLRAYAPQQEPVIAVLDDDANMIGRAIAGVQVLGAPHELDAIVTEFAVHGIKTDRIVIAGEVDFLRPAILEEVQRICQSHHLTLSFLPQMMGLTERKAAPAAACTISQRSIARSDARPYFTFKRWFDVLASVGLIVALSPILVIDRGSRSDGRRFTSGILAGARGLEAPLVSHL